MMVRGSSPGRSSGIFMTIGEPFPSRISPKAGHSARLERLDESKSVDYLSGLEIATVHTSGSLDQSDAQDRRQSGFAYLSSGRFVVVRDADIGQRVSLYV